MGDDAGKNYLAIYYHNGTIIILRLSCTALVDRLDVI